MAKNIAVTGCNSYLGKNLISYLAKIKYNVRCISRDELNDNERLGQIIRDCSAIIHVAAITNPYDNDIWKVNVNYTNLLVDKTKKLNKKFIYISSQNVLFGKDNYSKSKMAAEKLVKKLKDYVIIRPTIIYGENESKYVGKLIKLVKSFFIIPIMGNGKNKLQPIYIDDLTSIIEKCTKKNIKGIFLVAGKSVITYNDLADLIIKSLNLKRVKIHIPIFLLRLFAYFLQWFKNPLITNIQLDNIKINQDYDVKKIEKTFNIKLKTINEGLKEMLR